MSDVLKGADARIDRVLSRRASLGLLGGGALAAVAGLAGCGSDSSSSSNVGGVTLQATDMSKALRDIQKDENSHVTFLTTVLGANARPAPTFDTTQAVWNPPDINTFLNLANALENTGTGAYTYAAQYLVSSPATLVAAASIGLVEGRHAGFLNIATGRPILTDPTPGQNDQNDPTGKTFASLPTGPDQSQEVPQPPSVVGQRAAPFLVNLNLNGGPGLPDDTFSTAGTGSSLVTAVLNYALLLEYLEMMWYNRNVPRFYV